MNFQWLYTLGNAFVLFCDLDTVGYTTRAWHKYLTTHPFAHQVVLRGYSETALNSRPLSQNVLDYYAKFRSSDDFFHHFATIFPKHTQNEIPALRIKICSHYNLYQFQGFIDFIRQFPEYPQHVASMADRLRHDKKFHYTISNMQGFGKHDLCKFIKEDCRQLNLKVQLPCC